VAIPEPYNHNHMIIFKTFFLSQQHLSKDSLELAIQRHPTT